MLIATNAPTVQSALSNIEAFSVKLDKTTADLQSTLANNRTNITAVVENWRRPPRASRALPRARTGFSWRLSPAKVWRADS